MGITSSLLVGIAEHLQAQGACAWNPTGIYPPGSTACVLGVSPPEPDRLVVINDYPVAQPGAGDLITGIQVITRGTTDPRTEADIRDDVFAALNGLSEVELNGVWVQLAWRQSGAYLGIDEHGRHRSSANFYVRTAHPDALSF